MRFPYTKDTYNNPQNLWTFAYVTIVAYFFSKLTVILIIRASKLFN